MFLQNSAYYLAKLKIIGGLFMKKFTRIFSFLMALVFCFAMLSLNVFAAYLTCDEHPDADWYVENESAGQDEYHVFRCASCDRALEVEMCTFLTVYDCTQPSYCSYCGRIRPAKFDAHDPTHVYRSDANKHYMACTNDINCEVFFWEYHDYVPNGNGVLECSVCGRRPA